MWSVGRPPEMDGRTRVLSSGRTPNAGPYVPRIAGSLASAGCPSIKAVNREPLDLKPRVTPPGRRGVGDRDGQRT